MILTIRRITEGVRVKNFKATLLLVDFSTSDFIHRLKLKQILRAYGSQKETITAMKYESNGSLT